MPLPIWALVIALIGSLAIGYSVWAMHLYVVIGTSMEPALLDGEKVIGVRGVPKRFYRRGDIVVVKRPRWAFDSDNVLFCYEQKLYIKRIAGLEGDLIGDHAWRSSPRTENPTLIEEVIAIPMKHCYLRSDANGGIDSRYWGPVDLSTVEALVIRSRFTTLG